MELELKRKHLLTRAEGVVVPYSEQYEKAHYEFALKMWPNKLRRRNPEYIRWKFRGLDRGPVDGLLLAVIDGQVVGQFGLIPVTISDGERELEAQWACDLMVDSNIRFQGIGSLLLAVSMERGMITLGSEPSHAADIAMTRMGFEALRGPTKMILPIQVRHVLSWKMKGTLKPLLPSISKFLQPFWDLHNRRFANYNASDIIDGNLETLIQSVQKRQSWISLPHVIHDENFLRWRFSSPISAHINILNIKNNGFAVCEGTQSYFYVYDWHAKNFAEVSALFAKIVSLALEAGSQTILVYANTSEERNVLHKFGFLAQRNPVKVIIHPHSALPKYTDGFHYRIYDSDGNL